MADHPTLAQAVEALDRRFPPGGAEQWDRVGLVVGDPAAPVRRVLFAVDPVLDVVAEAERLAADLVVTHHPLLLRGVHSVAATGAKGAVVHRLIRSGIALYAAHTNADVASPGVADALAEALGLLDVRPLLPSRTSGEAPASADVLDGTGTGRVGRLPVAEPLSVFATRVAAALPPTAAGVRFAGDPTATVSSVAVLGGSGDGFFDAVRAAGVDVYVTADLRHHPASEAREQALFEAATGRRAAATPYLVDVSHAASEWLWLPAAATNLVADLGGSVTTHVSTLRTDPWTGQVASPTFEGAP